MIHGINKTARAVCTVIFITAGIFVCRGQADLTYVWADSLNTAKDAAYLTQKEKDIVFELNKVRTNPQQYVRYIKEERAYFHGNKIQRPGEVTIISNEGVAAVDECIAALEQALPAGILRPDEEFHEAARYLANDHAKTGRTSHYSSDGASLESRIRKYVKQPFRAIGENICYSAGDARRIVITLLVDDGVPSRGHRENIMNANYDICGVAIDSHPKYRQVCVIDFGKLR